VCALYPLSLCNRDIEIQSVAAAFKAVTVRLGHIHNIQLEMLSFVPGHPIPCVKSIKIQLKYKKVS